MSSPDWQVPNTLLEISQEITPKRMKGWGQKQKQHPVVDVTCDGSKVDAVKSNITQEPGMLGP